MDITPLTALDAPAAEAAIVEWSRGLAGMVDSLQSHTEAAERLEQAEAPRHAPAGERTRRSETLRAFRKVVFDMLDYVRDKQLTSRFDQYQAAHARGHGLAIHDDIRDLRHPPVDRAVSRSGSLVLEAAADDAQRD